MHTLQVDWRGAGATASWDVLKAARQAGLQKSRTPVVPSMGDRIRSAGLATALEEEETGVTNTQGCRGSRGNLTLRSHYLRPSTDDGFLTHPCDIPGCITKALDSVFACVCKT